MQMYSDDKSFTKSWLMHLLTIICIFPFTVNVSVGKWYPNEPKKKHVSFLLLFLITYVYINIFCVVGRDKRHTHYYYSFMLYDMSLFTYIFDYMFDRRWNTFMYITDIIQIVITLRNKNQHYLVFD